MKTQETDWIEWDASGKKCGDLPQGVTDGTMVKVAFYNGSSGDILQAGELYWGDSLTEPIKKYKICTMVPSVPAVNKYSRMIAPGVYVDVYDVLKAFGVNCPALQHLIKKALAAGNRGHKDLMTDLDDIIDSALRAKELAK